MRAALAGLLTGTLTSPALRDSRRFAHGLRRSVRGDVAVVHYFHDVADPYSAVTAQLLPRLRARYRIELVQHLVPPPDAGAAPDAARLAAWSRRDAAMLAAAYGLVFPCDGADAAGAVTDASLLEGDALRRRLGHYLGATFYFEGEWYWGVDRLHYLEARLAGLGLDRSPGEAMLAPVRDVGLAAPAGTAPGKMLECFLSFRSPYSYIALPRARALAAHYGAELRLRFVLPMVMRGLPVPRAKRIYIMLDTKREAERLGMAFGTVVDPVGAGVERGLAVLHHAIAGGRGEAFALSFLQGVFAEGIDAGSDAGLHAMAARAGIDAGAVWTALQDSSWRALAEANREAMLAAGLWGVPCFRVDGGPMLWGQDRLWVVERALRGEAPAGD
jgi:2-hydroxychromene-2-carboxylate isomerase